MDADGIPVVAVARQAVSIPGLTRDIQTLAANLLDEQSVEGCFASIAQEHGPVRALIHCAGTWAPTPLESTSLSDWESVLRTNLTTAFLCFSAAAKHMADGGSLIAFASAQGADAGVARQSAYGAAKAGIVRLVESAALELAPRGITAYAIAPSTILYEGDSGPGVPAEDLASLCSYLLTPEGRSLSGKVIRAYGVTERRPERK